MSDKSFQRLLQKFNQLDNKVQHKTLKEALHKSSALVQASAKRNAPANDGELRQKIHKKVSKLAIGGVAEVYTAVRHGIFVELGTGPEGKANHSGISPEVTPSYRSDPWWISGKDISEQVAKKYKFPRSISATGEVFYLTDGQAANPYLYPALVKNENKIKLVFVKSIKEALRSVSQ